MATQLAQAARGDLARLVAVVAVFAGLVLAHGTQCSGAMVVTAPGAHVCMGDAMHDEGRVTAVVHDPALAGPGMGSAGEHRASSEAGPAQIARVQLSDMPGSGGLLGVCMAFVLGVVIMVMHARPRPSLLPIPAIGPNLRRLPLLNVVHPRACSLAELCLLRT